MTYNLRNADGSRIRAVVEINDGAIRLHSRGGATGGRAERNPGYGAAFAAILDRLHPQEEIINRVILDSRVVRKTGEILVLAASDDFKLLPVNQVAAQIRRLMRDHGRAVDAKPNQGNSTKAVLFEVALKQGELVRRLLASEIDDDGAVTTDEEPSIVSGQAGGSNSNDAADQSSTSSDLPSNQEDNQRGETVPPSDEDRSWAEGHPKRVEHLKRERAAGLANTKRKDFIATHGRLHCEKCGLVPRDSLGEHGDAVIEVHHMTPVSSMSSGHETRLDELKCLCANCHRIVHREMARSAMLVFHVI